VLAGVSILHESKIVKTCIRCNTPIDTIAASVTRCVSCQETVAAANDRTTLIALAAIKAAEQSAADAAARRPPV
jgi:hypothetical protein